MKLIRELVLYKVYKNVRFKVYLSEFKTVYYISSKRVGYEGLCAESWRYSKQKHKTLENVVDAHIEEVCKVWNI